MALQNSPLLKDTRHTPCSFTHLLTFSSLRAHLKLLLYIVLVMDLLSCPFCDYSTKRRFNLDRHVNAKHNGMEHLQEHEGSNVAIGVSNVHLRGSNVHLGGSNVHLEGSNVHVGGSNVHVSHAIEQAGESNETRVQCDKCYKTFTCRKTLNRHRVICRELPDPLMCPYCDKIFPSRQAKSNHCKKCKTMPRETAIALVPTTSSDIVPHTINNVQNNVQNNVHNNVQNQQNISTLNIININNFGHEKKDHITNEVLDQRLREVNGHGIYNLIRDIHFNPEIPENQNVRMGVKRDKSVEVKEDDQWRRRDHADILDIMIQQYKTMLSIRSMEPDFKEKLEHKSDFMQIQQDLLTFGKSTNRVAYYKCIRKVLRLIENLDVECEKLH